MTSVPFDLQVIIRPESGKPERYDTVEFRFTTKHARALERAAGSGISWLLMRGQTVEALVLLVCYGLQWQYPKLTEEKAILIIDAFLERGGNTRALSEAVQQALQVSGIYGRDEEAPEASERPLAETSATTAPVSVTG